MAICVKSISKIREICINSILEIRTKCIKSILEIRVITRCFSTHMAHKLWKQKISLNLMTMDLLSRNAHKIYGPKGIWALYVRRRPRVRGAAKWRWASKWGIRDV